MKTRARAGARLTGSLSFRLGVALALVLAIGGVAVSLAAYAYGRSAAQQSYDRLLVGAANQIAGSLGLRDGEVIVDIPGNSNSVAYVTGGKCYIGKQTIEAIERLMLAAGIPTEGPRPPVIDIYEVPAQR